MPKTSLLLSKIEKSFPKIRFKKDAVFSWSPSDHTVHYIDNNDDISLLHEVAHAALGHKAYTRDIELLTIEREAWDYAVSTLSEQFDVSIDVAQVDTMIDTYREWLHARSLCPTCQATGIQADKTHYCCLACTTTWRVNEARTCALRRYKTK